MTYQEWLNGGECGCGCNDTPKPITGGCDCNDILLQISMLDTDIDMLSDAFDVLDEKVDDIVVPTNVSDLVNDAGYLTEHQPLKTINGQVISGTGNIVIEGGGTAIDVDSELSLSSTNPVENKVITEALNGKLDASAYTPTDLSEYWTSAQTNNAINAAVSGKADASAVYTKQEVDAIISGLTETIANLQFQINQLQPSGGSKLNLMYTNGDLLQLECDGNGYLESDDLGVSGFSKSTVLSAEVGSCVTELHHNTNGEGFNIGTFYYCTSMSALTLNEGLIKIGSFTISMCESLSSLTIPSTVEELDEFAISSNNNLNSITFLGTTPPTIKSSSIDGGSSQRIYVPAEALNAYKTAPVWKEYYAHIIEPIT